MNVNEIIQFVNSRPYNQYAALEDAVLLSEEAEKYSLETVDEKGDGAQLFQLIPMEQFLLHPSVTGITVSDSKQEGGQNVGTEFRISFHIGEYTLTISTDPKTWNAPFRLRSIDTYSFNNRDYFDDNEPLTEYFMYTDIKYSSIAPRPEWVNPWMIQKCGDPNKKALAFARSIRGGFNGTL